MKVLDEMLSCWSRLAAAVRAKRWMTCWAYARTVVVLAEAHSAGGPPLRVGARAADAVFADIARWDAGWLPIEEYGKVTDRLGRLLLHSAPR